ncbi:uncharacterized protein LOC142225383 [Haematobia irritans]|uniref:uncharacterized protein LOC142225383 n=1 Tax=Haematobia irritans TaxID=7368 RepID=UPI003F502EFE
MLPRYFLSVFCVSLLVTGSICERCDIYSTSATCQKLNHIFLSMDENMDPCDDFYDYACKKWNIRQAGSLDSVQDIVDYQTNLKLISIMESMANEPQPPSMRFFNLSLVYYQSCVNGHGARKPNLTEYLRLIKPAPGLEWPMVEELQSIDRGDYNASSWQADSFDIFSLLGELQGRGLNKVFLDCTGSSRYFTLGLAYNTDTLSYAKGILEELGFPPETAKKYSELMQRIHSAYNSSHRISFSRTYQHLKAEYPELTNYIDNIGIYSEKFHTMPLHIQEELLNDAKTLFRNATTEEKRNICNYIMVRMLHYFQKDSARDFSKLECINDLRNKIDLPVNLLYYENIYKPQESYYNADIPRFFNKTREYIWSTLPMTKLHGVQKNMEVAKMELNGITLNMGNVPQRLHGSYLNTLFHDIPNLDVENYYRNQLYFFQHRTRIEWGYSLKTHSRKMPTRNDDGQNSSRPFYNPVLKIMIVPWDILQPPIYHYSYHPIFKWSLLGFAMSETIYRNLMFPSMPHTLTDMMAANLVFRAYIREQQPQLQPEFTNLSWQRLFFLNLAQLFCSHNSSSKVRLNELAINSEYFGRAFYCSPTSKMKSSNTRLPELPGIFRQMYESEASKMPSLQN